MIHEGMMGNGNRRGERVGLELGWVGGGRGGMVHPLVGLREGSCLLPRRLACEHILSCGLEAPHMESVF